jgi:transposase
MDLARYLEMSKRQQLEALLELGWPERRIARELGIHRRTVRRYAELRRSKCTKTPADPEAGAAPAETDRGPPVLAHRRPFLAAVHHAEVLEGVEAGDSAQVIYQGLVERRGYPGSYDSVKRYVRHLKAAQPERAVGVMHHAPGEEAQVDYFQGPPTLDGERGAYHRPWVFRMTLCHSRHGYEEAVWRLDLPTFLALHERAFRAFGGVVQVVRHDNTAAGVSRACFFDPDSNTTYLAFARHWAFTPLPTKPYSPSENGKQERAGGYCKHNAYRKGQRFESLAEHNAHLRRWNERWARTRIHGTTRRQVWAHFTESDLPALRSCPLENFALFECGTRKVAVDAHIKVAGSFYPVPLRLVGEQVHVRWDAHLVRVFSEDEEVALHARVGPGRWALRPGHDPSELTSTQTSHLEWLKRRSSEVGPELRRWADAAHEERGIRALRLLQGVLRLADKHSRAQMRRAASDALEQRLFRYAAFQRLAARPAPPAPERVLTHTDPVIRPIEQYSMVDFLMAPSPTARSMRHPEPGALS